MVLAFITVWICTALSTYIQNSGLYLRTNGTFGKANEAEYFTTYSIENSEPGTVAIGNSELGFIAHDGERVYLKGMHSDTGNRDDVEKGVTLNLKEKDKDTMSYKLAFITDNTYKIMLHSDNKKCIVRNKMGLTVKSCNEGQSLFKFSESKTEAKTETSNKPKDNANKNAKSKNDNKSKESKTKNDNKPSTEKNDESDDETATKEEQEDSNSSDRSTDKSKDKNKPSSKQKDDTGKHRPASEKEADKKEDKTDTATKEEPKSKNKKKEVNDGNNIASESQEDSVKEVVKQNNEIEAVKKSKVIPLRENFTLEATTGENIENKSEQGKSQNEEKPEEAPSTEKGDKLNMKGMYNKLKETQKKTKKHLNKISEKYKKLKDRVKKHKEIEQNKTEVPIVNGGTAVQPIILQQNPSGEISQQYPIIPKKHR